MGDFKIFIWTDNIQSRYLILPSIFIEQNTGGIYSKIQSILITLKKIVLIQKENWIRLRGFWQKFRTLKENIHKIIVEKLTRIPESGIK